jgi:hypothetical protein
MITRASPRVRYTDLHPRQTELASAVLAGLARQPKRIEPKFFYDERGSELFEAICAQPEYYLPDAEREILETHREAISAALGSGCVLIEPGAGSAAKVRLFLEELRPSAYVPLISPATICTRRPRTWRGTSPGWTSTPSASTSPTSSACPTTCPQPTRLPSSPAPASAISSPTRPFASSRRCAPR